MPHQSSNIHSKTPATITEALAKNPTVADLIARSRQQALLLKKIRSQLPESLRGHCLGCVPKSDGTLVLFTDSAAWASKLRFYQKTLISAVQPELSCRRIRVKILQRETAHPHQGAQQVAKIPGSQVLDDLLRQAETTADPQLRNSLLRLFQFMRKSTDSTRL